jgi:hypothetical protein
VLLLLAASCTEQRMLLRGFTAHTGLMYSATSLSLPICISRSLLFQSTSIVGSFQNHLGAGGGGGPVQYFDPR